MDGKYIAEDGANSVRADSEDGAFDAFMETYGQEPHRILEVLSEGTDNINSMVVWENDGSEDKIECGQCGCKMDEEDMFRCADCGKTLCEGCASGDIADCCSDCQANHEGEEE